MLFCQCARSECKWLTEFGAVGYCSIILYSIARVIKLIYRDSFIEYLFIPIHFFINNYFFLYFSMFFIRFHNENDANHILYI